MAQAASSRELKQAFEEHTHQTEEQFNRLDRILKNRGTDGAAKKCKAMTGLLAEADDLMKEEMSPEILDVGLITAAQKVEHYEIAGYGCTTTYAKLLGLQDEFNALHQTLNEEKATDGKLTVLAKNLVNEDAASGETPEDLGAEAMDEKKGRSVPPPN